mgnify:CR=1 FL=1
MRLETFTLGDLDTNTYLIVDDLTQECAVIDPADDAQFISDEILRQNLKLSKIIATHGHFDHNLATAELQLNFDVPFLIHKDDQFLIEDIASRTKYWLKRDVELKPPQPSAYLEDQMQLRVGSLDFQVVHTPGHTPGCCVLVCKAQEIVFTGCLLYTSPSPRDRTRSRMPSSA